LSHNDLLSLKIWYTADVLILIGQIVYESIRKQLLNVYSYGNPALQKRICLNAIFGSYIIIVPADLLTIFATLRGIFKNTVPIKATKRIETLVRIINFQNGLMEKNKNKGDLVTMLGEN
jgi:hypothetical protein